MSKFYARTPKLKEIGIIALLLSFIGLGALFTFIDDDIFFRMLSAFAFFMFIYYTRKTALRLFFNSLEIRDGLILIPGRKLKAGNTIPENSFSDASGDYRHFVFGDMHRYKITIDNIENIGIVADGDIASVMRSRIISNASYSMITNDNEIIRIDLRKPLIRCNGDTPMEGHEGLSFLYLSVRDREGLINEIAQMKTGVGR